MLIRNGVPYNGAVSDRLPLSRVGLLLDGEGRQDGVRCEQDLQAVVQRSMALFCSSIHPLLLHLSLNVHLPTSSTTFGRQDAYDSTIV